MDTTTSPFEPAKPTDILEYSQAEHLAWERLWNSQREILSERACARFLELRDEFKLPANRVPQIAEVSQELYRICGWQLAVVPGLLSGDEFYQLVANRIFPSTTFIRGHNLEFSIDPDIFHEIFGHGTMLLDERYSTFVQRLGSVALQASPLVRAAIHRLFWFTIEVGLVSTPNGPRIFGGALLSSPKEAIHCLTDDAPRYPFDLVETLRSPFRADIFQERYFCLNSLDDLCEMDISLDTLTHAVKVAEKLGEKENQFEIRSPEDRYASVGIFPRARTEG